MFLAGVKTLEATTYFRSKNRIMGCTTYWEPVSNVADFPALQLIANDMQTQITTVIAPMIAQETILPVTRVIYSDGSTVQLDAFSAPASGVTGGAASSGDAGANPDALPDIDALVVQKRTALRGRQHNGRIFIPCIAEVYNDNGTLTAAAAVAAEDIAVFLGADQTFGTMVCHARHFNRKDAAFEVVVDARVRRNLARRSDRSIVGIQLAY